MRTTFGQSKVCIAGTFCKFHHPRMLCIQRHFLRQNFIEKKCRCKYLNFVSVCVVLLSDAICVDQKPQESVNCRYMAPPVNVCYYMVIIQGGLYVD